MKSVTVVSVVKLLNTSLMIKLHNKGKIQLALSLFCNAISDETQYQIQNTLCLMQLVCFGNIVTVLLSHFINYFSEKHSYTHILTSILGKI